MQRPASLLGIVCGFVGCTAVATTISAPHFTIEVPDGWTIEDDNSGTAVAFGNRIVDRMPMPFLSIQYCTNSNRDPVDTKDSDLSSSCTRPCSAETLLWTKDNAESHSPVERRVTPSGIVELRTESLAQPDFAAFAGLSCSPEGQVYVGLVSDEPRDQVGKLFEAAFVSIAWKQSAASAQELIVENRRLTVKEPLALVQTRWGDGVIFPAAFGDALLDPCSRDSLGPGDAYWQPVGNDVMQAEQILSVYMSRHGLGSAEVHTGPNQPALDSWPELKSYQRQYVGVVRGAHKTIYASFAPAAEVRSDKDWRRRPFKVCDGGNGYFGVETDLTASSVLHIAFDTCMCRVVPEK